MLEHWCGLRVREVAAPRIADTVDEQHTVKAEIALSDQVQTSTVHLRAAPDVAAVEAIFIRALP